MSIFRPRPRCPFCDHKGHAGRQFHVDALARLDEQVLRLQKELMDAENAFAPKNIIKALEAVLVQAVADRDMELMYLSRATIEA